MSLPNGYKRLEYIRSSGTQYIDTGFKPNQDTRVVMDVEPSNSGADVWFFEGRHDANSYRSGVFVQYSLATPLFYSDYGTSRLKLSGVPTTSRITIDKNKNVVSIGSVSVTHGTQTFQSNYNLYLLCNNTAGTKKGYVHGKLYSCQIYDNGALIRDYIPCQTTSEEIGLWDDVNSVFYGNAGTGTFIAGPVVTSPSIFVNINGIWKPINHIYVNINNIWQKST